MKQELMDAIQETPVIAAVKDDAGLCNALTNENIRTFIDSMEKSHLNNAIDTIMKLINDCADHK